MGQALAAMRDGQLDRTTPGSDVYANLSPVIGTYVGPGAVGLGFIQE